MSLSPRLLEGARAHGAFALRTVMQPPWCLRIKAESPLTLLAVISGHVWVRPDRGEPHYLLPGAVALTRAPDHYSVSDALETPPQVIIHPGQDCRDPEGNAMLDQMTHGIRTWGNNPNGSTVFLVGAYEALSNVSDGLLSALPPVLSLTPEEWRSPLVAILAEEIHKDEPGQAAVLDRLMDLLLVAFLKEWFALHGGEDTVAVQSQEDPLVRRALQRLHGDPARAWTLAHLAQECGASRASLARRFVAAVGEPPMRYLTQWRLAKAADMLCTPHCSIGAVAEAVGYSSPFAFSTAFKRARGISPQDHRSRAQSL